MPATVSHSRSDHEVRSAARHRRLALGAGDHLAVGHRAVATTAERLGYDAIAFTDHPAPSSRWVDSGGEGVADLFTSLGFCAAVTERVRLLTYVLLPTYRNPFVTAHQVATLDHLSAGR